MVLTGGPSAFRGLRAWARREGGAEWAAGPPLYSWPAARPSATRCGGGRSLLRGAGRSCDWALGLSRALLLSDRTRRPCAELSPRRCHHPGSPGWETHPGRGPRRRGVGQSPRVAGEGSRWPPRQGRGRRARSAPLGGAQATPVPTGAAGVCPGITPCRRGPVQPSSGRGFAGRGPVGRETGWRAWAPG